MVHQDRLHRAGCRGAHHPQAQRLVGVRVVPERLLTAQSEDLGREKDALGVSLAAIQVDDEALRLRVMRAAAACPVQAILVDHGDEGEAGGAS